MNDLLTDRLHEATEDLAARLRSGSAVRAVATRRRQRQRMLAGAVAAVAVGVVVTSVQVENNADRLVPTVDRSSSPAPSTSPTAEPTPAPSSAPLPLPTGSSVPSPSASPTGSGTSGNPLAGFHLPEEKKWLAYPPAVTVTLSRDPMTAWLLDPCIPTAYPTDSQRVAMLTLTSSEGESSAGRQLAVYPDAATAADVMTGFRRVLAACATHHSPSGSTEYYFSSPVALGDEALLAWNVSKDPSGRQVPFGGYDVVVRDGRSVYLASIGGEFQAKGPTDMGANAVIAAARATLPLPQ